MIGKNSIKQKSRMVSTNVPLCVIINEAQIGRMGSVSTFHHQQESNFLNDNQEKLQYLLINL